MDCGGIAAVADPGERTIPPLPTHFFTKMRPKGPKNIFWETGPSPYLSFWMTAPPPPLSEGLDLPLCRLMEKTLDNEKNDFFHNSNN